MPPARPPTPATPPPQLPLTLTSPPDTGPGHPAPARAAPGHLPGPSALRQWPWPLSLTHRGDPADAWHTARPRAPAYESGELTTRGLTTGAPRHPGRAKARPVPGESHMRRVPPRSMPTRIPTAPH